MGCRGCIGSFQIISCEPWHAEADLKISEEGKTWSEKMFGQFPSPDFDKSAR